MKNILKPTLAFVVALAGCSAVPQAAVPPALAAGPGEQVAMTVAARGVQIYECKAGEAGAAPQWRFTAPQATLYDIRGRAIGLHGAGPYWEASDGSRLEGKLKARSDAPTSGAIPWLLLSSTSSGPTGRFTGVSSIQRVHTQGGVAPAGGCDASAIGQVARVPYTADYVMLRAAAGS